MTQNPASDKTYSVPFVDRTEMRYEAKEWGYCRLVMPLGPNANHVDVMYMGADAAEASRQAALKGMEEMSAKYKDMGQKLYLPEG